MLYYLPIGKITIKGEFKSEGLPGKTLLTASPASSTGAKPGGGGEEPPQGAVTITGGGLTLTLVPEVEADEKAGEYYVTPHANYIYEDESRIAVNGKHLLSTGNLTTEDKTADIVGALASMAGQIKGFAEPTGTATPTPTPPFYFSFHPSNPAEVTDVKNALKVRRINFEVTYAREHPQTENKEPSLSRAEAQRLGEEGLIFRPGISYKVELRYPDATKFDTSTTFINTTQQFILPATDRLYEVNYDRMAFVKKVKEIGFRDGMLTEYRQKVPSPILGFLGIPKAVLQAIVPIPGAPPPSGSASGLVQRLQRASA